MKQHWLDKWENEENNKFQLLLYQRELESALVDKKEIEAKLKSINYRILQLKEYINDLT